MTLKQAVANGGLDKVHYGQRADLRFVTVFKLVAYGE